MQIKLCPKCGAENKPDRASCSGCYVSLEGVALTEAKEQPAPVKAPPTVQQPPTAQPPAGPSAAGETPGPNYGPPTNYGPPSGGPSYSYGPTNERRTTPIKPGVNWGAIVFVILLLGGAGFAGWWFFLKPSGPELAVQRMIDATKEGDWDKFKSCLSQKSLAGIQMLGASEEMMRQGMKKSANKDEGGAKVLGTTYETDGKTAYVKVEPTSKSDVSAGMTSTEIALVLENGEWKVDFEATGAHMRQKPPITP